MRFRIPAWYDDAMDWIACHVLPPPKPLFKLFGRQVTWTDVGVIIIGLLMIASWTYLVWGWSWGHFSAGVLGFVLAWMVMEWFL
jgi:hypothetical protein